MSLIQVDIKVATSGFIGKEVTEGGVEGRNGKC